MNNSFLAVGRCLNGKICAELVTIGWLDVLSVHF
jgi:hypothetical protein